MYVFAWPERFPVRVIGAIGATFALAYGLSLVLLPKPNGRLLIGDALHHYVQLRSAVFDHDLHFRNEYVRMYGLEGQELGTEWIYAPTATGHVRNLMPIGPAILWTPAFLMMTGAIWVANATGAAYPLDGYGRLFQATAGFSGIAAAALGIWFSYLTCAQLFTRRAAIWACLVLWLSSSAIYYSVISPTYSHAASLLTVSTFWFAFVGTRQRITRARYGLLGALAGCAALMRWQDAILVAVVLIDLLWQFRRGRLKLGGATAAAVLCLTTAALAFAPQLLAWQALYGQPLAIPQGQGFMRWSQPALVAVLISDNHGLLSWTPIVAVALAGIALLWRRDRQTAMAAAVFFLLSWYVNAAAADWWAGEAFGARRFVSCFPILTLGLAALIDRWSPSLKTLAVTSSIVVLHTFLLLVQYQAYMKGLGNIVPYPRGAFGLWLARFVVPFDLIRWWVHGS